MFSPNWSSIALKLSEHLEADIELIDISPVSGGDIHHAYQIRDKLSDRLYFVKVNRPEFFAVLQAEAASIASIRHAQVISTTNCIVCDFDESSAFLVMEFIALHSEGSHRELGQQLAQLHRVTANRFGFDSDNFIGTTTQKNTWYESWVDFWVNCRLIPQLELAYKHGFEKQLKPLFSSYLETFKDTFGNYSPVPSLVHGDLWSGNKAFLSGGQPVIFDPACYYGDREVDVALTYLFGGFDQAFYQGYEQEWPLDKNYKQRQAHYNLYHLLNHLNLFGAGYLTSCIKILRD